MYRNEISNYFMSINSALGSIELAKIEIKQNIANLEKLGLKNEDINKLKELTKNIDNLDITTTKAKLIEIFKELKG